MKFLRGSKKEFFEFVNLINEDDKIGILTHTDLDGIASGIFLKEILKAKGLKVEFIEFMDLKSGMMKEIIPRLRKEKLTKIFMTDLAVDRIDLKGFYEAQKEFDIISIDHHPMEEIPEGRGLIKTESEDCIAWVMYNFGKRIINQDKWRWLVCAGMVAEYSFNKKEHYNFIQKNYSDFGKPSKFNSSIGKITNIISYSLVYFSEDKRKVYDLVQKNNLKELEKHYFEVKKEIDFWVSNFKEKAEYFPEKGIYFYEIKPKFRVSSIIMSMLSAKGHDKVYASILRRDDGTIKISIRNQGGNVDVNLLMQKGCEGLKNATGGGHSKASGAVFMEGDLEKFKENVLKALK